MAEAEKNKSPKLKITMPVRTILTSEEDKISKIYNDIIELLKKMSGLFVDNLFTSLNISNIIAININPIGFMFEHYFVYVKSCIIRNESKIEEEINVNQTFYKSSGKSRTTGLENIWLPTNGINILNFIKKLDDNYILLYENLIYKKNYKKELIHENILIYGRFITELNAKISKCLFYEEKKNPEIFKGKINWDKSTDSLQLRNAIQRFPGKFDFTFNELIPDIEINIIKINIIQTAGKKIQYYTLNNIIL